MVQGHNLMQAIARVNRVFEDKEGGLVVDYVGIASALKQAMNDYTATLRKNKTVDWQKKDSARARMRMMIKKLLKTHKYPPDDQPEAIEAVMTQCELWADNIL